MLLTWLKCAKLAHFPLLCHLSHFWHNLLFSTLFCSLYRSCSTHPHSWIRLTLLTITLLVDLFQPPGKQGPDCQLRQDSTSMGCSVWSLSTSSGGAHRRDLLLRLQLRGWHHHYRYTLSPHTYTHISDSYTSDKYALLKCSLEQWIHFPSPALTNA